MTKDDYIVWLEDRLYCQRYFSKISQEQWEEHVKGVEKALPFGARDIPADWREKLRNR